MVTSIGDAGRAALAGAFALIPPEVNLSAATAPSAKPDQNAAHVDDHRLAAIEASGRGETPATTRPASDPLAKGREEFYDNRLASDFGLIKMTLGGVSLERSAILIADGPVEKAHRQDDLSKSEAKLQDEKKDLIQKITTATQPQLLKLSEALVDFTKEIERDRDELTEKIQLAKAQDDHSQVTIQILENHAAQLKLEVQLAKDLTDAGAARNAELKNAK